MPLSKSSRPVLRAITVLFAACADASVGPEALDPSLDVVAQTSADAALADLGFMRADIGVLFASSTLGAGPAAAAPAGPKSPRRNATFYDADGNVMEAYDSLLTASLSWSSSHERQMSRGAMSGSMAHEREMKVSGLLGIESERIHNGSGQDARQRLRVDDENGDRSYSMQSDVRIEGVVRPVDRDAQPWPLSGSITRTVQIDIVNGPEGDVSRNVVSVLTFDGSQFPTMLVNGEAFEVDLAARPGKPAAERKQRRQGR